MTAFDSIDFLERAVQTPSHEDVTEMRELLVDELGTHGVTAEVDAAGNTIATRGDGDPHVVLNTHIDTVTPHVGFERDGDVIRGRGSCDAKGPLAALLDAFLRDDPETRVTLAITPDEETRSTGAAALDIVGTLADHGIDATAPDAYIVGEPTGLDICNAARGRFEATVTLRGANAHAAEAHEGVNAVRAAGFALDALETFDATHGPGEHESLGGPTLTPTVIRGGGATNQVPAECTIVVDRRSVPPESADGFRSALEAHLHEHIPSDVPVTVTLADRPTPFLEAFATPPDAPLVRALEAASDGAVRPFTAATEASYFAADAPTVVFGPGVLADEDGGVAHADREYVPVGEVLAAADAVAEAIATLGR